MELTNYTSYDEIRAVLGVSDEELADETLALPIYGQKLAFEFSDLSDSLQSIYADAQSAASPTAAQTKLLNTVQVFSAYAVAKHLLGSASLFAPKRIGDGRAEVERFADPFEHIRNEIEAMYRALRQRVLNALAALGEQVGAATSRSYVALAGLPNNTITNEAT